MISCRGKPLTPETKKLAVSVKQYFDRNRLTPAEPSVKRTADALGIGIATVKRIMADYNRNPNLLDEPTKMRGRPVHAVTIIFFQNIPRRLLKAPRKKSRNGWSKIKFTVVMIA